MTLVDTLSLLRLDACCLMMFQPNAGRPAFRLVLLSAEVAGIRASEDTEENTVLQSCELCEAQALSKSKARFCACQYTRRALFDGPVVKHASH